MSFRALGALAFIKAIMFFQGVLILENLWSVIALRHQANIRIRLGEEFICEQSKGSVLEM